MKQFTYPHKKSTMKKSYKNMHRNLNHQLCHWKRDESLGSEFNAAEAFKAAKRNPRATIDHDNTKRMPQVREQIAVHDATWFSKIYRACIIFRIHRRNLHP